MTQNVKTATKEQIEDLICRATEEYVNSILCNSRLCLYTDGTFHHGSSLDGVSEDHHSGNVPHEIYLREEDCAPWALDDYEGAYDAFCKEHNLPDDDDERFEAIEASEDLKRARDEELREIVERETWENDWQREALEQAIREWAEEGNYRPDQATTPAT